MKRMLTALAAVTVCMSAFAEDAYIQSDGKQAINTGYFASYKTKAFADFQFTSMATKQRLLGADRNEAAASTDPVFSFCFYLSGDSDSKFAFSCKDGKGDYIRLARSADVQRHTVMIDAPSKTVALTTEAEDEVTAKTSTSLSQTSIRPLGVFGNTANSEGSSFSNLASARVHVVKLFDEGVMQRFLIPYCSCGVSGLKDVLTGSIYSDYKGTSFAAGGDLGLYDGYDAEEMGGATVSEDFAVSGSVLYDKSCWRKNGDYFEYRVHIIGKLADVSVDGGTAASETDIWVRRGEVATCSLTLAAEDRRGFWKWSADVNAQFDGDVYGTSVGLTVSGPSTVVAMGYDMDDPYADVDVWLRSFGNGTPGHAIDSTACRDSLTGTEKWESLTAYNTPFYTNMSVRMPYRGVKSAMNAVCLPQTVTYTNAAQTLGYISPNGISLDGIYKKNGITDANYTLMLRFRPDSDQPNAGYSWLVNNGNFLIGLNMPQKSVSTNTYYSGAITNKIVVTKHSLKFRFDGNGHEFYIGKDVVWADCWNDLIISIHGSSMDYVIARYPFDEDEGAIGSERRSSNAGCCLTWGTVTLPDGANTFAPAANGTIALGGETLSNDRFAYTRESGSSAAAAKCFRGAIQQLAIWRRPLTVDAMRAAIGWPRTDVMRIGVTDGSSDEFVDGNATNQEDWRWSFPRSFGPGNSATVSFNVSQVGLEELPQFCRWVAAKDSGCGCVKVILNGNDCGTESVSPGAVAKWRVNKSVLVRGVNTLVLTRTDSGAEALRLDALHLGGSWQVGDKDGSRNDFGHENGPQSAIYDVCDGNFFDHRRAIFGSLPAADGSTGSKTNAVYRFALPRELKGIGCKYVLHWKMTDQNDKCRVCWSVNGMKVFDEQLESSEHECDVTALMREGNSNEIELWNGAAYVKGTYMSLDYVQLEIKDCNGLILFLR